MRVILILLFLSCFGETYGQNNVRYVAAKNGLIVRDQPGASGRMVSSIPFNQKVVIKEGIQLDTIDFRVARWQRISVDSSDIAGYVFGGYLNRMPLPTEEYGSLRNYIWRLLEKFEVQYEVEYLDDDPQKSTNRNVKIQGSDRHLMIHEFGYEWKTIELNLYNWEIYEVINLIELASWFGECEDYKAFRQAVNPENLEAFRWITAFDDPEGEVFLQKRYPRGVRIIETASL